jgi:hypothetical protein
MRTSYQPYTAGIGDKLSASQLYSSGGAGTCLQPAISLP